MNYIEEARSVIREEAKALELLADNLPERFDDAVNMILEAEGRLVVSAIGKSGHIGRKISSTMASLGQKSFFLHPSEAHHGDLGMLDKSDVLLLISYSGEAVELLPVMDFAKRVGIKIVSISGNCDSMLAKNSDVSLCFPCIKEAEPLGVAPTVSTTVTLALGDALSVALLSRRGFTLEKFKLLHPGGALGRSLAFIFDIMHKDIPILSEGQGMSEAIVVMSEFGFGCVGIVDQQGHLAGIITDGDLRRNMSDDLLTKTVDTIMTKNPVSINKNIPASELLRIMEEKKITNIFVTDADSSPIGLVHIHDIITKKIV